MNRIFKNYLRRFILVFFDDILVVSIQWNEHLDHLRKVFEILQQNKLFANRKKCIFGQQQVQYLGHVVSGDGVAAEKEKIVSILEWPMPQNVKALRGFLGITGYYRKFIKNYGIIAAPTELARTEWTYERSISVLRMPA